VSLRSNGWARSIKRLAIGNYLYGVFPVNRILLLGLK